MKLNRHDIENEYRKACDTAEKKRAKADKAAEIAANNRPELDQWFTHKRNDDESYHAWKSALNKWESAFVAPAEKLANEAAACELYAKALAELLNNAVKAELIARIANESFISKVEDKPIRYKAVQKALFAGFGDEYSLYLDSCYYRRVKGAFWPDKDACYYRRVDIDIYLPGLKGYSDGDMCFDRELIEHQKETESTFKELDNWPSFAELRKACAKAPAIKEKRADILSKAEEKAAALVDRNSFGIYALRNAIAPNR